MTEVDGKLYQYLSDLLADMVKETDIIECWATHEKTYLTLAHIIEDVCAIPTTSVPCKHLFFAGSEITTDHCSHLGSD